MTRIHATAWAEIGAADLGPTIERVLRRTRRDDVRVVALSRQPNAFATVFPAETVRVRLSKIGRAHV